MSLLQDHLCPDQFVEKLEDIDLDALWDRGFRAILLDLDNTIAAWKSHDVPDAKAEWIKRATERFHVCIVSNTVHGGRARAIAARFGIGCVAKWLVGRKPSPRGIHEATRQAGFTTEQTVMIGDQVMTDVWAGRRAGVHTILVEPVSSREFPLTKVTRVFERCALWEMRRRKMI
jgi:HAD superfamily phosphatase (TIGR01668 family)